MPLLTGSRKGRQKSPSGGHPPNGKAPVEVSDILPNKPTVVGSRGQNIHSGYLNRPQQDGSTTKLPTLATSGGVALNSA